MTLKTVPFPTSLPISYLGPDLSFGPLPAVFYFALSAKDSLLADPFCQPVNKLLSHPSLRIFSVDLPFHGEGFLHTQALKQWAQAFAQGENVLQDFLTKLQESIEKLLSLSILTPGRIATMGLSRGGFIASHITARFTEIAHLLVFAPLTQLRQAKDFDFLQLSPLLQELCLDNLTDILATKCIQARIGNRDIRVSTDSCYEWIRSLIESAYEKGIRSPPIELILKPSIGHQGHGTSTESFEEGASWLLKQLT